MKSDDELAYWLAEQYPGKTDPNGLYAYIKLILWMMRKFENGEIE